MNITLRQLRAFLAGAQSASFSEAAGKINLTQPGYSLIIRQLEDALDLKLFDRTTRRLALTPEGREFSQHVERILHDLDEAVQNLEDLRQLRRGRVRIAVLPSAASSLVPHVLGKLRGQHPDLEITVIERLAGPLLESVLSGGADFGFSTNLGIEGDLKFTPLIRDRLMCLLPEDHPLAARPTLDLKSLEAEPHIRFVDGSSLHYYVNEAATRAAVQLNPVAEVTYMTTAVSFVQGGMGYTILPELALPSMNLVGIRAIPLNDPQAVRRLGTITPNRKLRGPATLAVLNMFQRECQVLAV